MWDVPRVRRQIRPVRDLLVAAPLLQLLRDVYGCMVEISMRASPLSLGMRAWRDSGSSFRLTPTPFRQEALRFPKVNLIRHSRSGTEPRCHGHRRLVTRLAGHGPRRHRPDGFGLTAHSGKP